MTGKKPQQIPDMRTAAYVVAPSIKWALLMLSWEFSHNKILLSNEWKPSQIAEAFFRAVQFLVEQHRETISLRHLPA